MERWHRRPAAGHRAGRPRPGAVPAGPVRAGAAAVAAGDPASPGQAPCRWPRNAGWSRPRSTRSARPGHPRRAGRCRPALRRIGPCQGHRHRAAPPLGRGARGTPVSSPSSSGPRPPPCSRSPRRRRARAGTASGLPVQVALTTHVASGVLAVPVSALLALSGGGYGLDVVHRAARAGRSACAPGSSPGRFCRSPGRSRRRTAVVVAR